MHVPQDKLSLLRACPFPNPHNSPIMTNSESTTAAESTHTTTEAESNVVVDIDLWIFMALLLACAIIHLREKVKLPTSALMMLAGVTLRTAGQYIGMLGHAVLVMDNIEAETILLVFLPALIFECAFSTNWYTFKREIGQILLLATTAVVVSSVLTAVVIRYVLGFQAEFDWYSALMLGAILSATDHVAVVAQLKEVNADQRLETLIQGETLVNEGSVIVVFATMMKGATSSGTSGTSIVTLFARLSLGGIALGLGFGIAVSLWLNRLVNHAILETLLTFIATYLLFFTADATVVHFSGAISIVTFGLYMSAYGKILISPLVQESVHEFWELIGKCIEALILVLGGMLMGQFFTDFQSLQYSDIGALFAIFVLLHVVRAITILLHWPLLRLMGYGCSYKEICMLISGALKGTISIALGLMVFHADGFSDRLRDLVLFWSVGVSALSVTFDSMLFRLVVKSLGLESMTNVEENMLISVTTSILASAAVEMDQMKLDEDYNMVNWDQVLKAAGPETLFFNMLRATKNGRRLLKRKLGATTEIILEQFNYMVNLSDSDIILETRRRFFSTLKGLYWHQFEERQCSGPSALSLIESANRGLDSVERVMHDWSFLEKSIYPQRTLRLLRYLTRIPLLGRLFKKLEYRYITEAYDIGRNFIKAHVEAEKVLDELEIDIKEDIFRGVMKEPHFQIELAKEFLAANITNVYPEVYIFVQSRQACYALLYSERKAITEAYEKGVITDLEYSELNRCVHHNIKEMLNTELKVPTLTEMLKSCYLFKELPADELRTIARHLKEEMIGRRKALFEEREEIQGVYVVLKGRIREAGKDFDEQHYPGDVVGAQYILGKFDHTETTAETVIASCVVFLSLDTLKSFAKHPDFDRRLWVLSAKKAIKLCKEDFGPLSTLEASSLNVILSNSHLVKYLIGDSVPLEYGSILLEGNLANGLCAFCFIEGKDNRYSTAETDCVLLHFSEELGSFVRSSNLTLQKTVTRFEMQEKTPRIRVSVGKECRRTSTFDRRGSFIERRQSLRAPAVLPPVKPGKYKFAGQIKQSSIKPIEEEGPETREITPEQPVRQRLPSYLPSEGFRQASDREDEELIADRPNRRRSKLQL